MAAKSSKGKSGSGGSAPRKKAVTASKSSSRAGSKKGSAKSRSRQKRPPDPSFLEQLGSLAESASGEVASRLRQLALEVGAMPLRMGRALLMDPPDPALALQAGASLAELRELAGLTRDELSDALQLKDRTLLQAVESGTATLSFELILRLAALLARHDPVPFVLRFTRTYNPELWQILDGWGVGRVPLQYERERQVVNIYRRHDAARKLSDEAFAHVLDFTRAAFETALHFAAEQEHVTDDSDD